MTIKDIYGNDHYLAKHHVRVMLGVGWACFLGSWLINIAYYKFHPSAVEMDPRSDDKKTIFVFGRDVFSSKVMVKALYDYDAQENDEISIQAGVTFELVREGEIQVNLSAVKMNILQTTPLDGGQALLMDKKDSSLEIMWRKSE